MIELNLQDVPLPITEEDESQVFALQMIVLAVSVVLGVLLIALIVFFTIRERSLTRQLKALTTTLYEPDTLASKRIEPPNTNIYAVEGVHSDLRLSDAKALEAEGVIADDNMR